MQQNDSLADGYRLDENRDMLGAAQLEAPLVVRAQTEIFLSLRKHQGVSCSSKATERFFVCESDRAASRCVFTLAD